MSPTEVPTWDTRQANTLYPEMTLVVAAPAPDTLEALAAALEAVGFKVKDRDDAGGFKAKYVDWFAVLATTINWTALEITTSEGPGGTEVLVAASYTGTDRAGRKHASRGLSSAVRDLRSRGIDVTTTPWAVPEDRKKGKRR